MLLENLNIAAYFGVLATACCWSGQTAAEPSAARNMLSDYDKSLTKTIHAYGPMVSDHIPRSDDEIVATSDFVENIRLPDGTNVRVLVKAPAPAQLSKILKVSPKTPGQTANDYFAGAIDQAISGGYAAVVFPAGVYNFVAPASSKESHFAIKGAKDLTIDGQGSTLNFASPLSSGVTISASQRIVFKGFNVDWPNTLMASVGTIVSIDKQSNPRTMRVRIGSQYPAAVNTQIIALSPWDSKSDPANPHFALKNYQKEQYTNNSRTVYMGDNTFEVPYWNNDIVVGDVFLVRHFGGSPWTNAVQAGNSYDIDFENVNIYASPYLGFVLSGGGGFRLYHCSVTRLNAKRLISSAADAIHIADTVGDIVIEGGTFAYQGDDGLNIHGAVSGTAQASKSFLHWDDHGEGAWAPYAWKINEPIGFFDDAFGFRGATTFQNVSHPNSGLQINLKDQAPDKATQIADLSRVSARFIVRDNKFLYNRARGILLQSSFGLIENNTFVGQTAQGISIAGTSGSEGPGVQDVIFRRNNLSNVGSFPTTPPPPNVHRSYGAIFMAIQNSAGSIESPNPVHQNLIFDSNVFQNLQGPGIFLSTANNVVLSNNEFTDTNLSPLQSANIGSATLRGSIVITKAHNVYIEKNFTRGTTTGPISIDTTSTDGIRR